MRCIKIHVHQTKANPKAKLFLFNIVAAQCEHQIEFSVNPSGSDVAFTFEITQSKTIVFTAQVLSDSSVVNL